MTKPFALSVVSNEAFREIFQSMTEGIVVINQEGNILVVNRVVEEMFGYENDELNGKTLEILLPERYRGGHVKRRLGFNQDPSPRRMGLGRDLTALKKSGQEFPVEISLSHSQAGGIFIAIAFISDISQRKKSEEALKRSEEQLIVYASELEKKVQARTEDLNSTINKLEIEVTERKKAEEEVRKSLDRERELNELKSKFVSIASHEFRTPLSTILSSIALVDQYNERGEIEKITKHTQRVRSSVQQLTSILNDFLSLGKLEEGKINVVRELVSLSSLFADIHEEIKAILKGGQQVKIEHETGQRDVIVDQRIVRNILFNLLSNASKYSEPGKNIYLNSRCSNGSVEISIRDEGVGIPEEDQKYLFERFFRASNVSNVQGTGLGLNIVRRYTELLNGSITFSSEFGKGSLFTVTIPIE
ncbi:MAG TPA: PAS domain-containing sensor histidine kinase [Cyclobacteriaceae bacterium]|nr:PAS domain-containing sensor histidine kinase [Cyclobacteriaceae bacterium]